MIVGDTEEERFKIRRQWWRWAGQSLHRELGLRYRCDVRPREGCCVFCIWSGLDDRSKRLSLSLTGRGRTNWLLPVCLC